MNPRKHRPKLIWLLLISAFSLQSFSLSAAASVAPHPIDDLVNQRLAARAITPSPLCTDAEFLRRACLDLMGALPTAEQARRFLANPAPSAIKRVQLIDWIFEQPAFADYWAMRWGDVLRIKSEFPSNLWPNAVQAYHTWLRAALAANTPFDHITRDLLLTSGSNFRQPPVNFYRALHKRTPAAIAESVALVFMGVRLVPGSPEAEGFAAFFTDVRYKRTDEWKEEIVYFAGNWPVYRNSTTKEIVEPRLPSPPPPAAPSAAPTPAYDKRTQNPRKIVADWLTAPDNPWYAANLANRTWAALFGRGITQPVDDVRPDNPPVDPALLALLSRHVVENNYSLRSLLRFIATSDTYQRSSRRNATNRADRDAWSHYMPRRLDAELLADAIGSLTGSYEAFSSRIPEPYAFWPDDFHAVQNPDASVTTGFLETFGRPARDTSYAYERDLNPSMAQALYLLNSKPLNAKIEKRNGGVAALVKQHAADPAALANELYLALLSRYPTPAERARVVEHLAPPPPPRRPRHPPPSPKHLRCSSPRRMSSGRSSTPRNFSTTTEYQSLQAFSFSHHARPRPPLPAPRPRRRRRLSSCFRPRHAP
ncbi:DUF1553 domain-containing protein [Geminisphaera colitermitum]|uniref:DUF1553 domain-containing protein n=1 Tax=Geminisphaera colitermitum TaxID=1148786 RepID=UPI001E2F8002|nr:DUF1553 domain-containing protein [Geminisphaera colitermitum]